MDTLEKPILISPVVTLLGVGRDIAGGTRLMVFAVVVSGIKAREIKETAIQ